MTHIRLRNNVHHTSFEDGTGVLLDRSVRYLLAVERNGESSTCGENIREEHRTGGP